MSPFLMVLGLFAAYVLVVACLIGLFIGIHVWVSSLTDQRRKARRGGLLERDVYARVISEAESYTREAARR